MSFGKVVSSSVDGEEVFVCVVASVDFHGGIDTKEFVWGSDRHCSGGCEEVDVCEVGRADCFSAVCPCRVLKWWDFGIRMDVEYSDAAFGSVDAEFGDNGHVSRHEEVVFDLLKE